MTSMRNIRIFKYLYKYRYTLCLAVAVVVLYSLILLAIPWLLRNIINTLFESENSRHFNIYCITLLALMPFFGVIVYLQSYLLASLNNKITAELRTEVFNHLLTLPFTLFSKYPPGTLISRVTSDIMFIQMTLMAATVDLIRQLLLLAGGCILILMLNWQLALLILLSTPLILMPLLFFGKKIRNSATAVQDRSAELASVIEEMISGIKEIKSYTHEKHEQQRFRKTVNCRLDAMMYQSRITSLFLALIVVITTAVLISLLWFGGNEVLEGRLLPGDLVAILFYMLIILGPARESANKYAKLQESAGASKRVFEILDSAAEEVDDGKQILTECNGDVKFDNVSFSYPNSQEKVLKNISFSVKKGGMVAVVGRNGAGKTTLINLLSRFYSPDEGSMTLDNIPINNIALSSLRQHVGLIPQETMLFSGTISENIAYARPDATEKEIIDAAKSACAHDFIMEMEDHYNTMIGSRGTRLSTGERQRIAIARLFLKKCTVVILDEATSSLDVESVKSLNKAIENVAENRTSFVVTHNLASIKRADLILVMDKGEIVERGTHEELIRENGLYKKFSSI